MLLVNVLVPFRPFFPFSTTSCLYIKEIPQKERILTIQFHVALVSIFHMDTKKRLDIKAQDLWE